MIRVFFYNPRVYKLAQDNQLDVKNIGKVERQDGGGSNVEQIFCIDVNFTTGFYVKLISDKAGLYNLSNTIKTVKLQNLGIV
jgi:hypothetical protein